MTVPTHNKEDDVQKLECQGSRGRMGHSKAAKEKSHQRIVKPAAARFRERGVDGIGVAELMKEADLTHGGFYGHFDSREELVAEAVECALRDGGAAGAAIAGNKRPAR